MDHTIKCAESSVVSVAEYDGGVWIAIHRIGAHAGIPLTQEQAVQLRDALTTLIQDAAQ